MSLADECLAVLTLEWQSTVEIAGQVSQRSVSYDTHRANVYAALSKLRKWRFVDAQPQPHNLPTLWRRV